MGHVLRRSSSPDSASRKIAWFGHCCLYMDQKASSMSSSRFSWGRFSPTRTCQQSLVITNLAQSVSFKTGKRRFGSFVSRNDLSTCNANLYFLAMTLLQSLSEWCSSHFARWLIPPDPADLSPRSATTSRAASIADRQEASASKGWVENSVFEKRMSLTFRRRGKRYNIWYIIFYDILYHILYIYHEYYFHILYMYKSLFQDQPIPLKQLRPIHLCICTGWCLTTAWMQWTGLHCFFFSSIQTWHFCRKTVMPMPVVPPLGWEEGI